jgi:tetratricopeptide (TPR) repeat protein
MEQEPPEKAASSAQDQNESKSSQLRENEQESSSNDTSSIASETLSDKGQIVRAMQWASENSGVKEDDTIYLTNVGQTYFELNIPVAAIETLQKAKELGKSSWRCLEILAKAYYADSETRKAAEEMEHAIHILEEQAVLESSSKLNPSLKLLADWRSELGDSEAAIKLLEQAIQYNKQDYESYSKLLSLLVKTQKFQEAINLLMSAGKDRQNFEDSELTHLASMLLDNSETNLAYVETLLLATSDKEVLNVILKNIEDATKHASKKEMKDAHTKLLLYHGIVLAGHRQEEIESAVRLWQQCWSYKLQPYEIREYFTTLMMAASCLATFYFGKAAAAREEGRSSQVHVDAMQRLSDKITGLWQLDLSGRLLLARYYVMEGKHSEAKSILREDMRDTVKLLFDEDPHNDHLAYYVIASICLHMKYDQDALSAFYLRASKYDGWVCDGICSNHRITGRSWFCNICIDIAFDQDCFEKLTTGNLGKYICSRNHEWLCVPRWEEEYRELGAGKVRAGGDIVDGKRVGGEIVTVEKWIDALKKTWGIEDAETEKTNDETMEEKKDSENDTKAAQ